MKLSKTVQQKILVTSLNINKLITLVLQGKRKGLSCPIIVTRLSNNNSKTFLNNGQKIFLDKTQCVSLSGCFTWKDSGTEVHPTWVRKGLCSTTLSRSNLCVQGDPGSRTGRTGLWTQVLSQEQGREGRLELVWNGPTTYTRDTSGVTWQDTVKVLPVWVSHRVSRTDVLFTRTWPRICYL